jgi:DnaK suppressor protein
MASFLTDQQLTALERRLRQRRAELQGEIHAELLQADAERYRELAEEVHDSGEESVADLLSDVDLAVLDRHVTELRDIEDALQRMAQASYGICIDCGGEIEAERLEALPAAPRCRACQERYEREQVTERHPSL